ncbi:MAG TPA: hypothetical protein VFZ69_04330 [Longimicrobiales bacterium]
MSGAVSLGLSVLIGGALAAAAAPLVARAFLFVPLYAAALGFFQHREKT